MVTTPIKFPDLYLKKAKIVSQLYEAAESYYQAFEATEDVCHRAELIAQYQEKISAIKSEIEALRETQDDSADFESDLETAIDYIQPSEDQSKTD